MSTAMRNARGNALVTRIGNAAELKLYTAAEVLLATVICASPAAPAAAGGVVTFSPVLSVSAVASGTATQARITLSDDTIEMNTLTVSDQNGTGDVRLGQTGTVINEGDEIAVTSIVITEGNG